MKHIETSFTKLIGAKTPIVAAAMAGASGGALAAEVSLAGGFGFMSTGYDSPAVLQRELDIARGLLKTDVHATMPIGVGFLAWQLDTNPAKAEELLKTTLAARVQAIWLSFGNDLARWVTWIREHDGRKGGPDAVKLFIQVSTAPDVRRALSEWDADVIVVQGNEAGGHGVAASLPLLTLFPLLANEVAQYSRAGRPKPPVLAAGGLATGAHVASLLALGAAGAVLGTRFLLSPESKYTDSQRAALLAAPSALSVRTMAFDEARGTLGWPAGVDGRGLRNDTVQDFDKGEDLQVIREKFADSTKADDSSRMVVWAGTGVGFMNEIKPAKEIVKELHEECLACIKRTTESVKDS